MSFGNFTHRYNNLKISPQVTFSGLLEPQQQNLTISYFHSQ